MKKYLTLALALAMCFYAAAAGAPDRNKEFFVDWFTSLVGFDSQGTIPDDMDAFNVNPGQIEVAKFVVEKVNSLYPKQIKGGKLDVAMSDSGYVYIHIPSNVKKSVPSVMFMAHLDVTPEAPGGKITAMRHDSYDGSDINLPAGITISPSTAYGAHLNNCISKTIITSDGSTLLGADDKAGCTVLLGLLDKIMTSGCKHGDIYIALTQNEDIGMAADGFDLSYIGGKSPDMVIDVDGDETGVFSIGNFTAVGRRYIFHGNNVHPGDGKKGGYADALTAAAMFIGLIPPEVHPSASEKEEGYIHCYALRHPVDNTGKEIDTDYMFDVRLRYFDKNEGDELRSYMDKAAAQVAKSYPNVKVEATPEVLQYENIAYTMNPALPGIIRESAAKCGLNMDATTTRGGTTASMMAAKGLNGGPNLYSGQQSPHSCYEWTCIEDIMDISNLCFEIVNTIRDL